MRLNTYISKHKEFTMGDIMETIYGYPEPKNEINASLNRVMTAIEESGHDNNLRLIYEIGRLSAIMKTALIQAEMRNEILTERLDRALNTVRRYA